MNKEQEQIIDEAYKNYLQYTILGVTNGLDRIAGHLDNCLVEYDGYYEHFTNPSFAYGFRPHTQEEFIDKCKIDLEFSKKWKLIIEERELSLEERRAIWDIKVEPSENAWEYVDNLSLSDAHDIFDQDEVTTRLITITYNNKTIESYEKNNSNGITSK